MMARASMHQPVRFANRVVWTSIHCRHTMTSRTMKAVSASSMKSPAEKPIGFSRGSPVDSVAYLLRDQELMSRAKNYFAWQARLALPELGRRVVEIGCGIGNFTQMLLDREKVVAIDSEASCIERLRAR